MAKVINLRTLRKQKMREKVQEKKKQRLDAIKNVKKPERARVVLLNAFAARKLDGHKHDSDV